MSNAANITVYALAPPAVTCSITSAADGMDTACVPAGGKIQLNAIPSSGDGTYLWSTTSSKIVLTDATSPTVTVTAKNTVSSSRGNEKVTLIFTPTGETALAPITRDITVISVKFSASPIQSCGYDDMNNVPNAIHHVSVKRLGFTKLLVEILGGGTVDDLVFTSDNPTIAVPAQSAAGPGASFDLTIEGKDQSKAQTSFKALCKGGPICGSIYVNVYEEIVILAKVAKIEDQTSLGTKLSFPHLDMAATETLINTAYKNAVVVIHLQDDSPTGEPFNVKYDLDGTGTLTLGAGGVGPEIEAIKLDRGIGSDRDVVPTPIVVVRDVTYVFFLAKPALLGDNVIYIKGGTGVFLSHLKDGDSYALGLGSGAETVKIVSRDLTSGIDVDGDGSIDGYPFSLAAPLQHPHPVTDGIVRPIGGVRSFPIIVKEALSDVVTQWVIGHEIGHLPVFGVGGWADLHDPTNLMNESANFTDQKLRFNQWESVKRD